MIFTETAMRIHEMSTEDILQVVEGINYLGLKDTDTYEELPVGELRAVINHELEERKARAACQ